MKIVYVKLNDENKVVRVDTNKIIGYIRVKVEDDMTGDKLLSCYYIDEALKFDNDDYLKRVNRRKQKEDIFNQKKIDEQKLKSIEMKHRLASLTDKEALSVMSLFKKWNNDDVYEKGERVVYDNKLYNVLDDTDGDNSVPTESPSLYCVIE